MAAKNPCGKLRKRDDPYEIWRTEDGKWEWRILKKWQVDDNKPLARAFCFVTSPYVPFGEMGDVYIAEIHEQAVCVFDEKQINASKKAVASLKVP